MEDMITHYNVLFVPGAKLSFQTVHNFNLPSKDLTHLQLTSSSWTEFSKMRFSIMLLF